MSQSIENIIQVGPVSIPLDQVYLIACLLLSYFFSFIYYWKLLNSKSQWLKHVYIISIANIFLFSCFSVANVASLYGMIFFTFTLTRTCRDCWWMPIANFGVLLIKLSGIHLYFQYGPFSHKMSPNDITGPLMLMIIKLTSFAFDMHDSYKWSSKSSQKDSTAQIESFQTAVVTVEKHSKKPVLDSATVFFVNRDFPSFLEFLGYAVLFPGVLTGPIISFYEYRTFINGTYFAGVDATIGALAGRKRRALKQFLVAIFFGVIYAGFQNIIPVSYILDKEYVSKPIWYRLAYLHIANIVYRSKYYFAWIIAEGSYVIIGLGFCLNSSGKLLWDRLENVNPFRIETATDMRMLISRWNVCTNQWLNDYVYKRIQSYYKKDSKSSSRASIITYFVSAFWHGFFPGTYILFFSASWMTIVARMIYRNVTWPFGRRSQKILIFFPLYIMMDYILVPFELKELQKSWQFLKSCHFFGHISLLILTVILHVYSKFNQKK